MIKTDQTLAILLKACPEFAEVWGDRVLGRWAGAKEGPRLFVAFGIYASHVIGKRSTNYVLDAGCRMRAGSTFCGSSASISSGDVALGSASNTCRRYAQGSIPLAFAVSINP